MRRGSEPESRMALDAICQRYWGPLYAYVRRSGQSHEDALDLVQSFFLRLIDGDWLQRAEAEKGKLRTFLLTLLNRHMSSEWRKFYAEKRGGGELAVSLDDSLAESWYAETESEESSEALFDKQWALTILEQSLAELQKDYARRGLAERFEHLKGYLEWREGEQSSESYEEKAKQLNMTEGAVKVAVFRLRKQYREALLEQVKQTLDVSESMEMEQELLYLLKALGGE